ncbi:hypothetical protein JDV09_06135 [Mycobacterium sp. Y57]|uniref:hypothetical protein n=1 Tax=Mycolicibacterium xanthum TaxID=2796469 RepID=UPI001C856B71|nr:hypothetical protein [Mycolicibacterium xanthum]MBX7431687.1 hypothetical protein [Mycolicibacterium xanthum]
MLIIALVLAVVGLAALVMAVVTSNELIAWVCIGASVIGVLLLIVDGLRDRSKTAAAEGSADSGADAEELEAPVEEYPDEPSVADYEEEVVEEEPVAAEEPAEQESPAEGEVVEEEPAEGEPAETEGEPDGEDAPKS